MTYKEHFKSLNDLNPNYINLQTFKILHFYLLCNTYLEHITERLKYYQYYNI